MESTLFQTKKTLNLRGNLISLDTPQIMGILNVTPDSFYDGGRYWQEKEVLAQVEQMLCAGALIVDVGGYSSRPGALEVPVSVEKERVTAAIRMIVKEFPKAYVAVDTFRSAVAVAAIEEGACMINDISGGTLDKEMFSLVGKTRVPYILMHMRGTPQNMQEKVSYDDLVKEVARYFAEKHQQLTGLGARDIIIDPGFGFAKTREQNYALLKNLSYFKVLNLPILAGISRKSMIYQTLGVTAEEALNGTTALNMAALMNGTSILRVHDVKEAVEAVKLYKQLYP